MVGSVTNAVISWWILVDKMFSGVAISTGVLVALQTAESARGTLVNVESSSGRTFANIILKNKTFSSVACVTSCSIITVKTTYDTGLTLVSGVFEEGSCTFTDFSNFDPIIRDITSIARSSILAGKTSGLASQTVNII